MIKWTQPNREGRFACQRNLRKPNKANELVYTRISGDFGYCSM